MSAPRVLLYVQHLLGIGHLKRAALLADAMTVAGLEVTLVSGGFPVPGLSVNAARFVQLPPAGAADLSFKALVDAHGRALDDAWKTDRRDRLLDVWRETRPQLLLLELFPFGRRQMRFELLPLLDAASAATPRPVIASSVRDVLGGGQKDPARQQRMLELFERYFDHLLVHGDPGVIPFGQTFHAAAALGDKLHYTGYVVDQSAGETAAADDGFGAGANEVLVSVGGGAVGLAMLQTALRARPLTTLAQHPWRVLAGSAIAQPALEQLAALAAATSAGGVTVERNRSDFAQRLRHCRLSVSQGGYNTVMETLHAGARAVVVPFAGGGESEQTLRARLLAQRGWIDLLEEAGMTPQTLAAAIDRAAARPRLSGGSVNLDGAAASAELALCWASECGW